MTQTTTTARWLALAVALCLAPVEAEAQRVKPRQGVVYLKFMRRADAKTVRPGQRLEPRFSSGRTKTRDQLGHRVEALMENARKRVARHKPSRMGSIFATTDPSLWAQDLKGQRRRKLVKLAPHNPRKVAVVDARFYESAYSLVEQAEFATKPADRKRLLARAAKEAERYWTKPAEGPKARKDARPEVLLGGGAIFLGVEGKTVTTNRPAKTGSKKR